MNPNDGKSPLCPSLACPCTHSYQRLSVQKPIAPCPTTMRSQRGADGKLSSLVSHSQFTSTSTAYFCVKSR